MRTIWLPREENDGCIDFIERKFVKVSNEIKYIQIINELKDYKKYVASKNIGGSEKYLNMTIDEIHRAGCYLKYEDGNLSIYDDDYDYPYYGPNLVGRLINPRAKLLVFMQELKTSENLDVPLNLKSLIDEHPLEYVGKIYDISKKAGLSFQEIIEVLNELSPQISLFSIDVLDCIKLVHVESININEIKEKIKWCEDIIETTRNYKKREELENLCREYRNILYQVNVALGNREVLTLAKRINR